MNKFSIDYKAFSDNMKYAEKQVFKLSDVKDKLVKVAFDVYKFADGSSDELWQIQDSDDGSYIVAKYEDSPIEEKTASAKGKWDVLISQADINVFYCGQPIAKFAASKLGIGSDELDIVKKVLPAKLASDKAFVNALLNTLDGSAKSTILKLYPELL